MAHGRAVDTDCHLRGGRNYRENIKEVSMGNRSIKIKTTCSANHVNTTLASPLAPLGDVRDASVQIRQINNIPEDVPTAAVIRLFAGTCDITGLCGNGHRERLEFDYSELGYGKIIR